MKNLVLFLVSSLVISHATNECLWLTKASTCGDLDMCASGSCQKDCSTDGGIKSCPQRSRKYITYTYLGCQISQAEENCHQQTFYQDYSSEDKSWKELIAPEGTNLIRGMKYVSEKLLIGWDKQYVFKMDPTADKPQWTILGRSFTKIRHVGVLAPNHVYVVGTEYKMQDKNGRKFSIWHYNADEQDTSGHPGKLLRNYWSGIFDKTGVDGVHLMAPMHDEKFAILERVVASDVNQSAETGIVNIFLCDVETVDKNADGTETTGEGQKQYVREACTFRAQLTGTFPTDMAYSPDNDSLYIVSYDATGQPARNPEATHKYRNHVQRLSLGGSCRDSKVKCKPTGDSKTVQECAARISGSKTKEACSLQDGVADDNCIFLAGGDTSPCNEGTNQDDCSKLGDERNGACQWSNEPFCDYNEDPVNCKPYPGAETVINNQDKWSDTFYDMGFEVGHKRIYMVGGQVIPSVINVFDLDGTFLGHEPQYFPFHPCYDYPGQNFVSLATGNAAVAFSEQDTTLIYNRPPVTEKLTKTLEKNLECDQIEHEKAGLVSKWEKDGALAFKGKCQNLAQKQSVYLDKQCGKLLIPPEATHKTDTTVTFKEISLEKLNGDPDIFKTELAKYFAVGPDHLTMMKARCMGSGPPLTSTEECSAFGETATCDQAPDGHCQWMDSSAMLVDGHPTIIVQYKGTELEINNFCNNLSGHVARENSHFSASGCEKGQLAPAKAAGDGGTIVIVIILFALIGLVGGGGAWWYFHRKNLDADAKYGQVQEQNSLNTVESMNAPVESMYDAPANQQTNTSGDEPNATPGKDSDEPIVVTAL